MVVQEPAADPLRAGGRALGTVTAIRRYPVKSMLGEELQQVRVTSSGLDGDRELALLDQVSGTVATAKHPRIWRNLLQFAASQSGATVVIRLPDGSTLDANDPAVDSALSAVLGRRVHLSADRPGGAAVERPAPEDVLAHGVDADVPFEMLEIAQGTPGATFVDYAPVHLITSATIEHVGTEALRYRPNLVIDTPGEKPFAENGWMGRTITVGHVRLRAALPTPRCAVPTLEHGSMPRAPHAVRTPLAENRVDVPGFGVLPCAGFYAEVEVGGVVDVGDPVVLR